MRISFVVLVACSSGTPRDKTPRPLPTDASIDARVDAEVIVYGACDWNKPDHRNPRCAPEHQPLMRCRDVNGPSARFPKCKPDPQPEDRVEPIVLAIKRRGEPTGRGRPVVVDGGTNRGIDDTWHAILLDAKQRPIARGEVSCTRFDPDELECLTRLPKELLDRAKSARFTPPRSPPAVSARSFVLAIKRHDVTDRGLAIVIAGGTRHGIDNTWRADLVDANTHALANGRLTYTRLDSDEIEGLVQLTTDAAQRAKGVRFTPP